MWYSNETIKFWKMGYRLLKDKFVLFMGGMKNTGQIISGDTPRGCYNPAESTINFAVPSISTISSFNRDHFPQTLKPGVIRQALQPHIDDDNRDYIISVDGKKLVPGVNDGAGDIDLFGHEPHRNVADELAEYKDQINI